MNVLTNLVRDIKKALLLIDTLGTDKGNNPIHALVEARHLLRV
jgi:hypothetical protein